jgi:hypothetical protein
MHGQIRLGAWRNFVADQHTSLTGGFVWAATARFLGLPVSGFDRYTRESGQMRWRLMGAVQVMAAEGADVTRSAAGRHAGEVLLVAPAAGLSSLVSWQPVDADRVTARIALGSTAHEVTLTVAADGALAEVVLRRWGNPDNRGFGQYTFAAELRDEATFDGYTIPRTVVAGWRCGGERWDEEQFIRYTIDDARYC